MKINIQVGDWIVMANGRKVLVEDIDNDGTFWGTPLGCDGQELFQTAHVAELAWD
jgi:hypothetical protein